MTTAKVAMSTNTLDSEKGQKSGKKERTELIQPYWSRPTPHELDILDGGDHLRVTSCSTEVVGWWMGTLRARYPQDVISTEGSCLKMHPEAGVTLKLNKEDGTLKIKGKRHMQWFKENFDQLIEMGAKNDGGKSEMSRICDKFLALNDNHCLADLLDHLPPTGAFKHGPTYIYRLWRGLLDHWVGLGGDVYVISPIIDSRRMADILLILVKHKLSTSRLHLYTLHKCDGEHKFQKVLKDAEMHVKEIKGPNKKKLISDERLKHALQRIDTRLGRLYCKMIAYCSEDRAAVLITSASFHKWHFDMECGDTVVHFELSPRDLINHYLAPLGLAHQVLLDGCSVTPSPTDEQFPSQLPTPLPTPTGPGPTAQYGGQGAGFGEQNTPQMGGAMPFAGQNGATGQANDIEEIPHPPQYSPQAVHSP